MRVRRIFQAESSSLASARTWLGFALALVLVGCAGKARTGATSKRVEPARAGAPSRGDALARSVGSATLSTRTHQREIGGALARLRTHEAELRQNMGSAAAIPAWRAFGPDPYRLCALGGARPTHQESAGEDPAPTQQQASSERFLGVLRGSSKIVLLGRDLEELARADAPAQPTDCAVTSSGEIVVAGQQRPALEVFRVRGDRLEAVAYNVLTDLVSPRALAVRGQTLYVADEATGKLQSFAIETQGALLPGPALPLCRRPFALEVVGNKLIAACELDHALVVRKLENGRVGAELARIVHDGPFWGMSALEADGALWIAASGVEDHPLERFGGAFGYVDSFVYLYRVDANGAARVHALDTSDVGVLVPKGLALSRGADGSLSLLVTAYGSENAVTYHFAEPTRPPTLSTRTFLPGIAAVVATPGGVIAASPLLDRWARLSERGFVSEAVRSEQPPRTPSERLGEALVFTRLIAPRATSAGKNSRFSCETCHFEGGIDGRVHHTGRGDVRVTTRPLFGLLGNAPHFSRALDRDLTSVSHNEFRVAGLANPYDPWFELTTAEFPWLADFGLGPRLDPEQLRTAFLDFLAAFEPDQNPKAHGRKSFDAEERRGAASFREHCKSCHAARSRSDDAKSELDFERWESSIFSEAGPLIWARGDYEKCGVVPYVHERGTRIASLRRVSRKFPYFTNGSARTLGELVERVRWAGDAFFHANAPEGAKGLSVEEARSLVAFLELL